MFFQRHFYFCRAWKSLRKRFLFLLECAPNWTTGRKSWDVYGLD
ncbi:hypothetical protein HMPREF1619_02940 [Klebsiella pneumoniae 909957]|nr:hypothetical protein HMPREF1619_02940 [Klebsiella pneumoniae 909957]KXA21206.1 hypothetical protein HMPREF3197_04806 [Klebsiella pneumoniae]